MRSVSTVTPTGEGNLMEISVDRIFQVVMWESFTVGVDFHVVEIGFVDTAFFRSQCEKNLTKGEGSKGGLLRWEAMIGGERARVPKLREKNNPSFYFSEQ